MTNNWRSWCWHLGLASFLAIGGAITYSGKYAFAQVVDCNSMNPMSIEYLQSCNHSPNELCKTAKCQHGPAIAIRQTGNPRGADTLKLQIQLALPSPLKVQALQSATVPTVQPLPPATVPTVQALPPAQF